MPLCAIADVLDRWYDGFMRAKIIKALIKQGKVIDLGAKRLARRKKTHMKSRVEDIEESRKDAAQIVYGFPEKNPARRARSKSEIQAALKHKDKKERKSFRTGGRTRRRRDRLVEKHKKQGTLEKYVDERMARSQAEAAKKAKRNRISKAQERRDQKLREEQYRKEGIWGH